MELRVLLAAATWPLRHGTKSSLLLMMSVSLSVSVRANAQGPQVTELTDLPLPRHHAGEIMFSPDNKTLALAAPPDSVELWDIPTGKRRSIENPFERDLVNAVAIVFSSDGRLCASRFARNAIAICDPARPRETIQIRDGKTDRFEEMAFRVGTRELITITEGFDKSGLHECSSARWNATNGKRESTQSFFHGLRLVTISPDGRYVLLQNGAEQLGFDVVTARQIFAVAAIGGKSTFSMDGSVLVWFDREFVNHWDIPSAKLRGKIRVEPSPEDKRNGGYNQLAISPAKNLLAIGGFPRRNAVEIINLKSGEVAAVIKCCPDLMYCGGVCFSPDGKILATNTFNSDYKDEEVKPLLRFWRIPEAWTRQ